MTRLLAFAAFGLVVFIGIAVLITRESTPAPDASILRRIPPPDQPNAISRLCEAFVLAGIVLGTIVVIAVFLALTLRAEWGPAAFWFLTFAGVAVLDVGLKALFERSPLGDASDGYSFPSGNAMASMALVLALQALVPPTSFRLVLSLLGISVVILYGAAIVYLSWHYPSDVVAGWCLSLAWVSFLALVIRPAQALLPIGRATRQTSYVP